MRQYHLNREPLCVECGEPGNTVDHITPLHDGGDATDSDNLQTMCARCHYRKRGQEGNAKQRKQREIEV